MPPGFTLDQLRTAVSQDRIDTVLLALTDMQGRLQGKRLDARHFLKEVVSHGAEACNYLLAVDDPDAVVEKMAQTVSGVIGDPLPSERSPAAPS